MIGINTNRTIRQDFIKRLRRRKKSMKRQIKWKSEQVVYHEIKVAKKYSSK